MKKHNKLWNVLFVIILSMFILSCVAILNMCILYCYGITTPVIPACVTGSIAFVSLVLIPIVCPNVEED